MIMARAIIRDRAPPYQASAMHRLTNRRPWPGEHLSCSSHLRQGCLGLRQPEAHVHGAVEVDSSRQFGTGLFSQIYLRIQGARAEVAVGHERTHAKFFGQDEGLTVVAFGMLALRRLAPRRHLAQKSQGIRLVAPFLVSTGK